MGVLNHFYHSESTFEIGSLCNSIVHQIWYRVLFSKFLIFSFNTYRLLLQILASRFNLTDLSNVFLFNEWYHKVALYIFFGKNSLKDTNTSCFQVRKLMESSVMVSSQKGQAMEAWGESSILIQRLRTVTVLHLPLLRPLLSNDTQYPDWCHKSYLGVQASREAVIAHGVPARRQTWQHCE